MRLRVISAPVAIVAAGAALLFSSAAEARTAKVQIASNFYAPFKLTVKKNAKVRFVWDEFSFDAHDVNVKKGPAKFHSPLQAGGTWTTKRLRKPGRYLLFCSQHEEMRMTLTVKKK
ncbi:MAG TPA: cupredoxin domain-containing protein [Solirubrobacteraceae bacterium]|jgi:plastocyanin|nr:cupredoxin domain-containing protein [Solirubrobacteraceae bacterium]